MERTVVRLALHGGGELVIESTLKAVYTSTSAKAADLILVDENDPASVMGKRKVYMSLPRVKWLERPDI